MLHFKRRFNEGVEAANPMAPRSHQDYENETSMHFSSGAMQARGEHGWLLVTGAPGDGGRCRGWMTMRTDWGSRCLARQAQARLLPVARGEDVVVALVENDGPCPFVVEVHSLRNPENLQTGHNSPLSFSCRPPVQRPMLLTRGDS